MPLDPLNIWLMDVNAFIRENKCMPVTSVFIRETTTNEFKHDGLFSEDIFGQINTPDRLVRFGYIDLRTQVLHPLIYINIVKLKALYGEIMARKTYAVFNPETKEFERASEDTEDANTGYQFFMSHLYDLKFEKNQSLRHNEMVDVIERHQKLLTLFQCLVMPAGLRDLREDEGKPAADSINKLYSSLINYTLALPTTRTTSDIYDNVRFSIQKKLAEIYDYIFNMIEGKFGFFQRKYGSRNLALGTRNVVSTASMAALSPDDPQYLKMDEIKIPLFQACKMYTPLIIYNIRMLFLNEVFNITSDQVALIDPETNNLVYQPIDEDEKSRFLSSEGIEKMIDLFRDPEFRFTPVVVYNEEGKGYYLYMVYDDNEVVYLTRSVSEVINKINQEIGVYDPQKLRPLTYAEMFYIAALRATSDKNSLITRYPAIEIGSEVPNRVHLISTNPARKVNLFSTMDDEFWIMMPEYPIINNTFVDSLIPHPQILAGLGMDFDGDSVTRSTRITYRYKSEWLDVVEHGDYTISNQDGITLRNLIQSSTYGTINDWNVCEHQIGDFPRIGKYKIDNHGAKVFDIPKHLVEILSHDSSSYTASWEPITQVTWHDGADCVSCKIAHRVIETTANESIAIFDKETGGFRKVSPLNCDHSSFVAVEKKDTTPFGVKGTRDDGWFLGSMISDGWVSDYYIGYTKLDDITRGKVVDILKQHLDTTRFRDIEVHLDGVSSPKKLGDSRSVHVLGKEAVEFASSLDMYATDVHSALTKRIGKARIREASEEFLWGLLCGILDGDGSISMKIRPNGNTFYANISTSSPYLVDDLKLLCYRLGLRFSITEEPSRNWSEVAYTFCLSSVDMYYNLDRLVFHSTNNCNMWYIWKTHPEPRDRHDIIPLTYSEMEFLRQLALKYKDNGLYSATVPSGSGTVCRHVLYRYLSEIERQPSLFNRLKATNVGWSRVRDVQPIGKQEVYDFIVPTTKVFAVNDGVVVYDTASSNGILSKQANEEVTSYLNSVGRYIHSNGKLMHGTTDLIKLTIFNLSRDPAMV